MPKRRKIDPSQLFNDDTPLDGLPSSATLVSATSTPAARHMLASVETPLGTIIWRETSRHQTFLFGRSEYLSSSQNPHFINNLCNSHHERIKSVDCLDWKSCFALKMIFYFKMIFYLFDSVSQFTVNESFPQLGPGYLIFFSIRVFCYSANFWSSVLQLIFMFKLGSV